MFKYLFASLIIFASCHHQSDQRTLEKNVREIYRDQELFIFNDHRRIGITYPIDKFDRSGFYDGLKDYGYLYTENEIAYFDSAFFQLAPVLAYYHDFFNQRMK